MAEDRPQDEGFTFVDKRRAAQEGAPEESAPAATAQPEPESAGLASDIGSEMENGPGIESDPLGSYGLVTYVIGLLAADAWQKMGLIANPSTGKVEKDTDQARVAIDCVAALIGVIDKPEANLPEQLRGDLKRVLSDLRINFVEQSKR